MPFEDDDGMSMGEYEYQYALCDDPDEFVEERPAPSLNAPVGKWQVRSGELLEISEMSAEHIRNALKLFVRAGWGDHMKIRELREELARRRP